MAFNGAVPAQSPPGEPAPTDGALPEAATSQLPAGAFGWYVHVPFCRVRCGYCDFNTYTNSELGGGASAAQWAETAIREIRLARRVLAGVDQPATTVFFGGGTPTRLPARDLVAVLDALRAEFGIAAHAEITVEANPDDISAELVAELAAGGVNRMSVGMQSAVPQTLALLERTHRPDSLPAAFAAIREGGVASASVDLIYGTPGETDRQWRESLEAAVALRPDHVSAYCLGIEEGTKLGARVRSGAMAPVDPDAAADRYLACEQVLSVHGYRWYEISNWAQPGAQSRHNLGYWRGDPWWGIGPGAHSHVAGVRWWNLRHPRAWTARLADGRSPAEAREILDADQRSDESVMLGIRLAEGLAAAAVGQDLAAQWVAEGLAEWLDPAGLRFALTPRGRLLADGLALAALAKPAPAVR